MKQLIVFIFICSINTVFAEYRAYQYIVKNKILTAQDQSNSHLITSSMDPETYISYHGGHNLISIDLLRTWVCPGHTGNRKDICDSPYAKLSKEFTR